MNEIPSQDGVPTAAPQRRPRWRSLVWPISALVVVVVIAGAFLQLRHSQSNVSIASEVIRGNRPVAPALPSKRLTDSAPGLPSWFDQQRRDRASNGSGHIVVVNFWASWCGPCREEAPQLIDASTSYADDRVVVIGVNAGAEDLLEDAQAFAREFRIEFPLVRATRKDTQRWGVQGYPETFVVGRDGRIGSHVNGPLDSGVLDAMIRRELER